MKPHILFTVASSLVTVAFGCGGERTERYGTSTEELAAWANGNMSQVLRVNAFETTVRNVCELTVPLSAYKPLAIIVSGSGSGATSPVELGWKGSAVSDSGVTVNGCAAYPCEVVARRHETASNGTTLGCNIIVDDGMGRLTGTSTGTSLTVYATPSSPVIYNQDAKVGPSATPIAGSCVLRQSENLPSAGITNLGVWVNGVNEVNLSGPTPIGAASWPTDGPSVSFGNIYVGAESGATRLKHVAARKEQLVEGDALECAGIFHSQSGVEVFDVNVSGTPLGNGMSLTTSTSGWTCALDSFGTADGCQCDCGVVDPDCTQADMQCAGVCNGVADASCVGAADGRACDDRSNCTVGDACIDEVCSGQPIDCNDGNPCTSDACTPEIGCQNAAVSGAACDDLNSCTDADVCSNGVCVGGVNVCSCQSLADCATFEDGDLCNGMLVCLDNQCVVDVSTIVTCDTSGDTACSKTVCQPAIGACIPQQSPMGTPCDDGDPCTINDSCSAGVCSGSPSEP